MLCADAIHIRDAPAGLMLDSRAVQHTLLPRGEHGYFSMCFGSQLYSVHSSILAGRLRTHTLYVGMTGLRGSC